MPSRQARFIDRFVSVVFGTRHMHISLKTIYCIILSEEYIVALGPNIIDQMCVTLRQEAVVSYLFVALLPPGVST